MNATCAKKMFTQSDQLKFRGDVHATRKKKDARQIIEQYQPE
jgi:hypothetical protein